MVDQWTKTGILRDHVTQIQIINDIIEQATTISNLDDPKVVKTYTIDRLRGRIPLMSAVQGYYDVGELEQKDIKTVQYNDFDFEMTKDRVKIGISDEAEIDQLVGDSFAMQKNMASVTLADMLEQRIIDQVITTPQKTTFDLSEQDFFITAMPDVIGMMAPYSPTACVMSSRTAASFWGKINKGYAGFANFAIENIIPYSNTPIVISDHAPNDKMYFVSSDVPGVGVAKGKIIPRVWEDENVGGVIFQIDVFRQTFSNIVTTSIAGGTPKNKGVVEVELIDSTN